MTANVEVYNDYEEEYDTAEEDLAVQNHPVMVAMMDNLYKITKFQPNMSNDEAQLAALHFLEDTWSECFSDDIDADMVEEVYKRVLEELFIKLFVDMNFMLKLFFPHCLYPVMDSPKGLPNKSSLDKVVWSVLYPLETSGYQYPQCDPPFKVDASHYITSPDTAWRGSWEIDHDGVVDAVDEFPATWKVAVDDFLRRTAEYLYGGFQIDYSRAYGEDDKDTACT